MTRSRLGVIGIAIAVFVLISLILSAFFCAFPWSMCKLPARAAIAAPKPRS